MLSSVGELGLVYTYSAAAAQLQQFSDNTTRPTGEHLPLA